VARFLLNSFDSKWIPEPMSGCWLWLGKTTPKGYGQIMKGPRSRPQYEYAHRYSYRQSKGPIPDGMLICHSCDVPSCVNPDHLFLGDSQANMDDCRAKGRNTRGEGQHLSKLTDELVRDIRTGRLSHSGFAEMYCVSRAAVYYAATRKTWKHVI
jgi:hypothetical protein